MTDLNEQRERALEDAAVERVLTALGADVEEIGVKITKYGKRYRPDWAEYGERLVFFSRDERYVEAGNTGDTNKLYLLRDVWLLDEDDTIFCLKTCEYATKDEAGNKVWTRCPEGVDFCDIEPYEVK